MYKYCLILFIVISLQSKAQFDFDFDFDDEIEIPNICENIQQFVNPVDLSGACLSAQVAAQSFPPLLPSANRLCQILEGATATQGVIQMEINIIYEKCQFELNKLETEMLQGISEYADTLNNEEIKNQRLLNATTYDDLDDMGLETLVAGIDVGQWEELLDETSDPYVKQSKKRLLREVAKSNYVADEFLIEGVAQDLIEMVVSLLSMTGSDTKVKTSQDLQVRMSAELVYQQQAFQQILNQYLALVAVEQEQKLASERYKQKFFGGDQ